MPGPNAVLRQPVERCDEHHPRVPGCPKCLRWRCHLAAIRRDKIAAGVYEYRRIIPMNERPKVAPRCRLHKASKPTPGCRDCITRRTTSDAQRRWDIAHGTYRFRVAAADVRDLVEKLLTEGGHTPITLEQETGLNRETFREIRSGRRKYVSPDTADAIRAARPRPQPAGRCAVFEPALAVVRIYRGLAAQGWTQSHIAQQTDGLVQPLSVRRITSGGQGWVRPGHTAKARQVGDALVRYDIAELSKPLPGMDRRTANRAARDGWVPLRRWAGRDITDPHAEPLPATAEEFPDTAADVPPGTVFVDYLTLRLRIAAAGQDSYVPPMDLITKLESYAVVALAKDAGIGSSRTGAMLGYPQGTERERDTGERQVSRMRRELTDARLWFDTEPDGETPAWLAGRADFHRYLPLLLAVQPEPFGYGMTVAQLAERCGADVTLGQVTALLAEAATVADRRWQPLGARPIVKAGRRRRTARTVPARGRERRAA